MFDKRDTNICKGIAILLMVFHHTYTNSAVYPYFIDEDINFLEFLASVGKVCVSLLTILSGYGLSKKYSKEKYDFKESIKFSGNCYLKILLIYWPIWLIAFVISCINGLGWKKIYGDEIWGLLNGAFDLLGLGGIYHTTIFVGGWYLSAIIVFYFLFPFLYKLALKFNYYFLIVAFIPWVQYIIGVCTGSETDSFIFYIFSFVLGIILATRGMLDSLKTKKCNYLEKILVFALLFICIFLRGYFPLLIDPFIAILLIMVEIVFVCKVDLLSKVLLFLGVCSADIWLLHGFMKKYSGIIFKSFLGKYIFLVLICCFISLILRWIREKLMINKIYS